jgi:hypothetical protein
MPNGTDKKDLTLGADFDIILTSDEKRIVYNLREHAKIIGHGQFAAIFKVHHNAIKDGTISWKDTVQSL